MAAKTPRIVGLPNSIYWGTKGVLTTPVGVIVEDVTITPENEGSIGSIENGDGAKVSKQYLDDGFKAKIKVVYDRSLTWPAVGDAVTINLPTVGAVGGVTSYVCSLGSIPPEIKRKEAARIELTLEYNPGIDSTTVSNVTNLGS
jgi:hypothetical protein